MTMKTLRLGDKGDAVRLLQERLAAGLTLDGDFGPATQVAVEVFQEEKDLLVDGIVGRATWNALGVEDTAPDWTESPVAWLGWKKCPLDKVGEGYDRATLRVDVANRLAEMRTLLLSYGGKLTSSGGKRNLSKSASANQSKKSFHYTGRALDLWVYGGMQDLENDPYVIVPGENAREWVVFARAPGGEEMELDGWLHKQQKTQKTVGNFVNLTELFKKHGFEPIRARKSYSKSNYGASEWWHFQYEVGLVRGESTFGVELLKVWKEHALNGTVPWAHRDAVFGVDWF
jgi:hypothetical protein